MWPLLLTEVGGRELLESAPKAFLVPWCPAEIFEVGGSNQLDAANPGWQGSIAGQRGSGSILCKSCRARLPVVGLGLLYNWVLGRSFLRGDLGLARLS